MGCGAKSRASTHPPYFLFRKSVSLSVAIYGKQADAPVHDAGIRKGYSTGAGRVQKGNRKRQREAANEEARRNGKMEGVDEAGLAGAGDGAGPLSGSPADLVIGSFP